MGATDSATAVLAGQPGIAQWQEDFYRTACISIPSWATRR